MLGVEFKEEDFPDRKTYLVALAIEYIKEHTGYVGVDDRVFMDEGQCDGYTLANDLEIEFELEEI